MWASVKSEMAGSYTDQFGDLRAVLVSVCGKPALQHYEKSTAASFHNVASVTKSVLATLVGIAVADGSLHGVHQNLAELLPERRKDMTSEVAAITVRQLLTMTAGLDADLPDASVGPWINSSDFVGAILREGIQQPKGQFHYSSASSHLLAAILVRATGQPLLDYARAKLFDPLAIVTRPAAQPLLVPASASAYDKAGFAWPVDHQGVNSGGGYLRLTPPDMLKLGQLYLDDGRVGGRQIVPAQWVHEATTAHVSTRSGYGGDGYGYQWWVTKAGPDDAYAAVGYAGQLIEVVPARELVVVFATEWLAAGNQVVRADSRAYQSMVARLIAPTVGNSQSATRSAPSS
jgi:CubicO group peptidase (beta-lactamase class C family)